jgi:hypothetical protein
MAEEKTDQYGMRVVAFLDILGFSDAVRQIETDESMFRRIRTSQVAMRNFSAFPEHISFAAVELAKGTQISTFSDCIVVSAPNRDFALFCVGNIVLEISRLFLSELGLLIRGGITCGSIFHDGAQVFGRAVIEAYDIERNIARYPRVVVAPTLVTRWRQETTDTPMKLYLDLLATENDGVHFIDPFHQPFNETEKLMFDHSRGQLDRLLRDPKPRFRDWTKIVWLANRYNRTATAIGRPLIDIPMFPGTWP